jgi:hypothetical protein
MGTRGGDCRSRGCCCCCCCCCGHAFFFLFFSFFLSFLLGASLDVARDQSRGDREERFHTLLGLDDRRPRKRIERSLCREREENCGKKAITRDSVLPTEILVLGKKCTIYLGNSVECETPSGGISSPRPSSVAAPAAAAAGAARPRRAKSRGREDRRRCSSLSCAPRATSVSRPLERVAARGRLSGAPSPRRVGATACPSRISCHARAHSFLLRRARPGRGSNEDRNTRR